MLAKRIIACLDIKDGRTVKGTNFTQLRDAGDPVELAVLYSQQGADELVFLDISATTEKRKTLTELVTKIAAHIDIPFTVGGGINSIEDAAALLQAGADKISINSTAVKRPDLINEIAKEFGSQFLVLAIDAKKKIINGLFTRTVEQYLPTEGFFPGLKKGKTVVLAKYYLPAWIMMVLKMVLRLIRCKNLMNYCTYP